MTIIIAIFASITISLIIIWSAIQVGSLLVDLGVISLPSWDIEEDAFWPSVEDIDFCATQEEKGLDSFRCLEGDLAVEGFEVAYLTCQPATGIPVLVLEDELFETVDVSEFSDAMNPSSVIHNLIMDVNDAVVASADRRDGQVFDTVTEWVEARTVVLIPEVEEGEWLTEMVRDILSNEMPWVETGSDESTFFEKTSENADFLDWDEEQYALTQIQS